MDAAPFRDYATYGYGRFACLSKESGTVIDFALDDLHLTRNRSDTRA
jgi:hypothetical protein